MKKIILLFAILFSTILSSAQNYYGRIVFLNTIKITGAGLIKDTSLYISNSNDSARLSVSGHDFHFGGDAGVDSIVFDKPVSLRNSSTIAGGTTIGSGGGGSPSGATYSVQTNGGSGTFGGDGRFFYNGTYIQARYLGEMGGGTVYADALGNLSVLPVYHPPILDNQIFIECVDCGVGTDNHGLTRDYDTLTHDSTLVFQKYTIDTTNIIASRWYVGQLSRWSTAQDTNIYYAYGNVGIGEIDTNDLPYFSLLVTGDVLIKGKKIYWKGIFKTNDAGGSVGMGDYNGDGNGNFLDIEDQAGLIEIHTDSLYLTKQKATDSLGGQLWVDALGKVITKAPNPKVLALSLSQSGTSDPTVDHEALNQLGSYTITRTGEGRYQVNCTGCFPQDKTSRIYLNNGDGDFSNQEILWGARYDNDTYLIHTGVYIDNWYDEKLNHTLIEIRVYQ